MLLAQVWELDGHPADANENVKGNVIWQLNDREINYIYDNIYYLCDNHGNNNSYYDDNHCNNNDNNIYYHDNDNHYNNYDKKSL